ncbi:hypothetical protein KJ603_01125, partial [Patescibacteria group bacterium]|nr:hypothetical protein [Patescibacteria group bacterium]
FLTKAVFLTSDTKVSFLIVLINKNLIIFSYLSNPDLRAIKKDTLVSEVKKTAFVKKDSSITDKDKEKEIEPVKIVPKLEVEEIETEEIAVEDVQTEDEKKEKEDLDETIDNLIIK